MAESFRDKPRELNEHEKMHMQALYAAADQMFGVLKGDRPDPYCMAESIKKLEELVMWAKKAIEKGAHL